MPNSIRNLIFSPAQFFASEPEEATLAKPALVVVLTGAFYGLSGLMLIPAQVQGIEGGASVYLYAGAAFSWFVTVLMTLLVWVLYAGAFFTIATIVFGATGDFRRLFRLTGWGFVGQVVAGMTAVAARAYVLLGSDFGTGAGTASAAQTSQALTIASIVGMIGFLWSAYLWNYAVQFTLTLDLVRSLVAVGIPVIASIGLFYLMMILPGML